MERQKRFAVKSSASNPKKTTWIRRPKRLLGNVHACGVSESCLPSGIKLILNDVTHASAMFCSRQMAHMETMNWLRVQDCEEPRQHFHVSASIQVV